MYMYVRVYLFIDDDDDGVACVFDGSFTRLYGAVIISLLSICVIKTRNALRRRCCTRELFRRFGIGNFVIGVGKSVKTKKKRGRFILAMG